MFGAQVPMVSPEALPVPMAILSLDDGVVIYTNPVFKSMVRNCPVGKPLQGLLHTEEKRKLALENIDKHNRFAFIKKNQSNSLRFIVTREIYSGSPHFFIFIERISNEDNLGK